MRAPDVRTLARLLRALPTGATMRLVVSRSFPWSLFVLSDVSVPDVETREVATLTWRQPFDRLDKAEAMEMATQLHRQLPGWAQ